MFLIARKPVASSASRKRSIRLLVAISRGTRIRSGFRRRKD